MKKLELKSASNSTNTDKRKNQLIINGLVMTNCKTCNKTNYKYNKHLGVNFCSWKCYEENKQLTKKANVKCEVCGKEFYLKPYRIKRVVNGITCSDNCKFRLKSKYMSGKGNHQHGIKGKDNASFKGVSKLNQYGYVMKYLPNHPKADKDGRYREHRYVVEQMKELDISFFNIINDVRVLKDEYIVHHHDKKKTNNTPSNLIVLTKKEHTSHHNKENTLIRDDKGKIIGVLKSCELLENPEEDNQQPSITEM